MKPIYKDLKILLVEDDKGTIDELLLILRSYFATIDIAYDGEEGLNKALYTNYDIIITDIVMPKIDGITMIQKIKNKKKPKFIVITAYSNKDFFIELIELGIQGYLIKPITFKQIANTLKKVTDEIYKEMEIKSHIKEIERLSKIKSEFLANMSHEIRTPLNAILGFIKIMKEEDDGKFDKYLNTIDSASQTLLTVINDILDISKIEAGKMNLNYINFNSDELYSTIELFTQKANEKKQTFNINFINMPNYLYGDVHRIKQVLSNLLSNAIKFTPENKTITTTIKFKKDTLFVEVQDNGIGIDTNKQKIIFDSFNQADNSITRKYGGTGLGLSISHKLISMMNGELKVKSKLNKGSTFYFKIPIKKGKKPSDNLVKIDSTTKNLHLLIAEDNQANQMFMKIILDKMNISYDLANNGKEAVNLVKSNQYNLILMDINMPIMSGLEATKQIRDFNKNIPIIALTANALDNDKDKFLNAGMNAYLSKPLDIQKLKKLIENYS